MPRDGVGEGFAPVRRLLGERKLIEHAHQPGDEKHGRDAVTAAGRRWPARPRRGYGSALTRRSGRNSVGRRVSSHGERAQQEGVQDEPGVMLPLAHGAQPADEQQQLAQRGLLLDRGEPLGGFQHGHARGVARIIAGQRLAVGADHLGLSDQHGLDRPGN